MRLTLIAAGTKLPRWANEACQEYAGRLTQEYRLELHEIALGRRTAAGAGQAIEQEGRRMIAALPPNPYLVALQVGGRSLSSEQLAEFLSQRAREGRNVAFCIGGPDGLASAVDALADFRWSISALTLPHALVRVVVAEALYRAVTIIKGHPYHRA
ncbi:MAG TPA: 23S rRNA (pseudouridine(1915)-N(3))-methyltransferase RlmH [Steroidobacter sp.]|jgi:23S rRNA (pseudouridine1915-N3)-methyltransferase|nr:23S rRNA (pseudouridine(1915)-N(3))-methyltransferase RlmH [Steroidobacteraceae bacterium]HLS79844.1 23S rRNA (pseudouridine(1915)-N(3))-methyltransferase RlmH [Steroidobacter sp.]